MADPQDPVLLNAIRQLVTAQQNASKAKVTLDPQDQEQFMREETQGKYGLQDAQKVLSGIDPSINARNITRSVVQGATMNFGDEILGKLPAFLGGGAGPEADMRLREQLYHQQHPAADIAGNIAGGVGATLLAPEAKAVEAGGAMLRGAATGAAVGGLSGVGAGTDTKSRIEGGATGAVAGGALGAIIPGLVAGIKSFSPASRAANRLAAAVEESGGAGAVRKSVADATAAGRGGVMMLADASDPLRQEADFAANNSDQSLVNMAQKIRTRQADASDRLLGDVRAGVGGDPDAAAAMDQLKSNLKTFADGPQGYGGIREANPSIDMSDVKPFLDKPDIQAAWKQARLAGDITAGDPMDALFQKLSGTNPALTRETLQSAAESGVLGKDIQVMASQQRPVTFDDLHSFKQILDDKVQNAFQNGKGQLGNAYKTVRDAVTKALIKAVPDVEGVDAEYSRQMGLQRALTAGEASWDLVDTRGLAKQLAAMTPDQIAQFRTGMASRMIAKLRSAATNRDEATKLMDMSPALEDKLKVVFGNQKTFDRFMQNVSQEANLAKLKNAIGGSQTARRLQASGFDPAEIGISAAMHGPGAVASIVKAGLAKMGQGALKRGTARELGPMLMAQGPAIDQILQQLSARSPLVGNAGAKFLPAAGGKLGSLLGQ